MEIYRSYDPKANKPDGTSNSAANVLQIDCTGMINGDALSDLRIGSAISCGTSQPIGYNAITPGILRYGGNNILNGYPNPAIAASWDPNWGNFGDITTINCSNRTVGPAMATKT